jgi:hypothetical protein
LIWDKPGFKAGLALDLAFDSAELEDDLVNHFIGIVH